MGGIYTQERVVHIPVQNQYGQFTARARERDDYDPSTYVLQQRRYYQTTTSFRDRDPSGSNEIDPRQFLLAKPDLQRPFDRGHEFATRQGRLILSHPQWRVGHENRAFWRGPLMFTVPGDNISSELREGDFGEINLQYGTKAIKETIPTKGDASITQMLAELKQDLPRGLVASTFKNNKFNPRGIGDDYLNYVFGISPTINDLQKILKAIVKFDENLAQYLRDNGQYVRRRFDFEVNRSAREIARVDRTPLTNWDYMTYRPDWAFNFVRSPDDVYGSAALSEERSERYYFTGAFSYYLEGVSSPEGAIGRAAQIARKLLGIDGLTIDLAYQLTSFTWLLDWFVNIGDILSNATAFSRDNLVIRWGYLMRETRIKRTYTHSGAKFITGPTGPIRMTETFSQKLRVKATPFGFGLNPSAFTDRQWAILIALGMTQGNRTLL